MTVIFGLRPALRLNATLLPRVCWIQFVVLDSKNCDVPHLQVTSGLLIAAGLHYRSDLGEPSNSFLFLQYLPHCTPNIAQAFCAAARLAAVRLCIHQGVPYV